MIGRNFTHIVGAAPDQPRDRCAETAAVFTLNDLVVPLPAVAA
jgi:hypothetical protein